MKILTAIMIALLAIQAQAATVLTEVATGRYSAQPSATRSSISGNVGKQPYRATITRIGTLTIINGMHGKRPFNCVQQGGPIVSRVRCSP